MSFSVDINCDLGEGFPHDAELMKYISSANIACGSHAGDSDTMRRTVSLAIENGVAIGAHPGYRDRENFGRTEIDVSAKDIQDLVSDQIAALNEIAGSLGQKLRHVKPHGALYNRSARDPEFAAAIAEAVRSFDHNLLLFGLSESDSIKEAEAMGLRAASEVFADRTYQHDGSLTPRSQPNALIENDDDAIAQALGFIRNGNVTAVTGEIISVKCDTICIHGDGTRAVVFAEAIYDAMRAAEIEVKAI